jgi:peptide/nickel transport system substrate-binding protein
VAFFNLKHPLLKDLRLRQALALAVDGRELQDLIGSHASVVSSPFPFLQTTNTRESDLESARILLNTLGWHLPDGGAIRVFQTPGTVKPSTSSTELAITIDLPNQSDLIKVAELLKRRWSLIGVKVDVRVSAADDLLRQAVDKRDYQILIWNVLLPPTQDITPFWSSDHATQQGLNLSNLTDREVDRALTTIDTATSSAAIDLARQTLSTAILKQTPALFLLRPAYAYLVSRNVKGVKAMRLSRPSDRLLQATSWYIKTAWRWK